jgi:hypothetical protein
VRFEVLTAASTKMDVFFVVAPCSLVEVCRRFRGACCLHHQGESIWRPRDCNIYFSINGSNLLPFIIIIVIPLIVISNNLLQNFTNLLISNEPLQLHVKFRMRRRNKQAQTNLHFIYIFYFTALNMARVRKLKVMCDKCNKVGMCVFA